MFCIFETKFIIPLTHFTIAMKTLLLTSLLFTSLISIAQTGTKTKLPGENTLGFAFEIGGAAEHAKDLRVLNTFLPVEKRPSKGLTCFYEHQFNFNKNNGLILGIGLNATLFSTHFYHQNPAVYTEINMNGDLYTSSMTPPLHDVGEDKQAYYAVEFPIKYVRTFQLKNNVTLAPYIGVKFRNIAYITGEYRNKGFVNRTFEGTPDDTSFYMVNTYKSDTYKTNIMTLPTIGVTVSKQLEHGGKLNFFADFSFGLFNHVEVRYSNFDNLEKVDITYNDNGVVHTEKQTVHFDYESNGWGAVLALNMSHVRTGLSYTLPTRLR
jgi:hypothetical protein